jgi:hypothetical protein
MQFEYFEQRPLLLVPRQSGGSPEEPSPYWNCEFEG